MVKRPGSMNTKTRHLKLKSHREKGKISISRYFATFKNGDKVQLLYESAYQRGMFYQKFYGKVGTICGQQGRCYYVKVDDKHKAKNILVHPVHLRGVK